MFLADVPRSGMQSTRDLANRNRPTLYAAPRPAPGPGVGQGHGRRPTRRPGPMIDDSGQVDVDAPIPYRLTARALRELAEWRAEESFPPCPHEFVWHGHGRLCLNCGEEQRFPRETSIPSYVRARGDWKAR